MPRSSSLHCLLLVRLGCLDGDIGPFGPVWPRQCQLAWWYPSRRTFHEPGLEALVQLCELVGRHSVVEYALRPRKPGIKTMAVPNAGLWSISYEILRHVYVLLGKCHVLDGKWVYNKEGRTWEYQDNGRRLWRSRWVLLIAMHIDV